MPTYQTFFCIWEGPNARAGETVMCDRGPFHGMMFVFGADVCRWQATTVGPDGKLYPLGFDFDAVGIAHVIDLDVSRACR